MPPRKSTARAESPARSPARAKRAASPSRTRAASKSRARAAPKDNDEPVKPAKKTTVKKSTAKKSAPEEEPAPTRTRAASKSRTRAAAKDSDDEPVAPKRVVRKSTTKKTTTKDDEPVAKKSSSKKVADADVEPPKRGRKSASQKAAEEEEPVIERRPTRRSLARKTDVEEEDKLEVLPRRSTRGRSLLPADARAEARAEAPVPTLNVRTRSRSGARALPTLPPVTPLVETVATPSSPLDAKVAAIASDVYGGLPVSPLASPASPAQEYASTEEPVVGTADDFPFSSFLPAFAVSSVLAFAAAFFPILNASTHSAAVFRHVIPFANRLPLSSLRAFSLLELACISTFLAAMHVLVLKVWVPAKASAVTRAYAPIAARGVTGVAILALYAHMHLHYTAHTAANLVYLYLPVLALALAHLIGNLAVNSLPFAIHQLLTVVLAYPIVFSPTSSPIVPHLALALLPFVVSSAIEFILIWRANAPFPSSSSLYPVFSTMSSVCVILFLITIIAGPTACLYYSFVSPAHSQHVVIANSIATAVLMTGNVLAYITANNKQ